MAADYLADDQP